MQNYVREFLTHWKSLLAASAGLAAGTISNYINNLFTPSLIEEFGWTRSEFALTGLTVVFAAICIPIVGRVVDTVGTRRMAFVGVTAMPLVFIALSAMNGSFALFFALSQLQMIVVSCLAGVLVYTRLIARNFTLARGVALGIASCATPLVTVALSPALSAFIDVQGWRAGYLAMAAFSGVLGTVAILLIPPGYNDSRAATQADQAEPQPGTRYIEMLKNPTLILLIVAFLLCNMHYTLQTTQLKVVVDERGISSEIGSLMVSIFAMGVVAGRIVCGVALDRYKTHFVAAATFGVPSISLAVLAGGISNPWMVGAAVLGLGLAMGAEGDLIVYFAAKYFPPEVFSSVLGLLTATMAISASCGALILSGTLEATDSYVQFLGIAAAAMMVGSLSFLAIPRVDAMRERREAELLAVSDAETPS